MQACVYIFCICVYSYFYIPQNLFYFYMIFFSVLCKFYEKKFSIIHNSFFYLFIFLHISCALQLTPPNSCLLSVLTSAAAASFSFILVFFFLGLKINKKSNRKKIGIKIKGKNQPANQYIHKFTILNTQFTIHAPTLLPTFTFYSSQEK